ncbi:MAG: histidinol-phosphatase [Gammaproteobacteria bacterium]|nr:histidinol-phosphatase [Gammaproteobacteria bacterium]
MAKLTPPLPRHPAVSLAQAELTALQSFLRELLLAAGPRTLAHFRRPIEVVDKRAGNGGYDPVTEADREAEHVIRELIRARHPEHGAYGEEHGFEPGNSGLTWVIDPIDGTRAFITGQLHWGILIGLYDGEKVVLGGMHQPFTGELFIGGPSGASLEQAGMRTRLRTRECASLDQAVLCCTTPDMFEAPDEQRAFTRLEQRVRLRRFGGDCYSYCMLAHGLVDLVVESDLAPYDVHGLIPVVEGAGGLFTDWQGNPAVDGGRVVVAGDARLHAAALAVLNA